MSAALGNLKGILNHLAKSKEFQFYNQHGTKKLYMH